MMTPGTKAGRSGCGYGDGYGSHFWMVPLLRQIQSNDTLNDCAVTA